MANIEIISTSVIRAASPKEPTQRIDLTPWDLQLLSVHTIQKGLLFHKPKPPQNEDSQSTLIQHLKTSLSRTLDFFAPLAGRLAMIEHDDNTSSFYVDCNNAGAKFVHAMAEGVTIADIVEAVYVPDIVYSFFQLNGVKNFEGISKPLLAVQVTELVDGIFIGCTINHTVADGSSFWHFFNSWAEISHGFDHISNKSPILQRWFLDDVECPMRIPFSYEKHLSDEFVTPPIKERVFHFTKENIATLKAKANAEFDTNKISSLQALLAHIWLSVMRSRNLDPNQDTHYRFLIGARSRLHQLPEQYFGNAVQTGTITLKASEILDNGLGFVAWQMNKMVALHTEEKLRDYLKSWVENPKLLTLGNMTSNALVTGSSPRFNVYGNDFGWGRPVAVRSGAGNKFDWKITVFEGVEEGSVDIEACLSPEILQAMGNDTEFVDAITIN